MRINLTLTARVCLADIYKYYAQYHENTAERIFGEITDFIYDDIAKFPEIGHIYYQETNVRRAIVNKKFNIYYSITETINILFIYDARLAVNEQLRDPHD